MDFSGDLVVKLIGITLFVLFCFLFFLAEYKYSSTKFTKVPPKIIVAEEGSDAKFHWRLSFDPGSMDRSHFLGIVWGMSDGDKIRDKYITVLPDGTTSKKNRQHSWNERQRWGVSGNITKTETNQVFVLKSVTKSDTEKTFACRADVWGDWISSGPIHLELKGKVHSVGQCYYLIRARSIDPIPE